MAVLLSVHAGHVQWLAAYRQRARARGCSKCARRSIPLVYAMCSLFKALLAGVHDTGCACVATATDRTVDGRMGPAGYAAVI